jgi:hypothetical protein
MKFQLLVGLASGSSVVLSALLLVAQKQRGMNAKEYCSGMNYRTPGSSTVRRKEVLSALEVG